MRLFAGCFFLLLSVSVFAQGANDPEKASQLFQEGDSLYKVQDYAAALIKFKEAYFLSKEPELLFNIAQCNRLLGRYSDAAVSYRAFLREIPKSALAENAKARLAEIEVLLSDANRGSMDLSSKLSPVKVFVDGERKGDTPLVLPASPGRHTLRFEKDGFYPQEQSLMLEPKQRYAQQIVLIEEPPSFFVPGALGGAAALSGAAFLGLFFTAKQRDFEREGATLRAVATATDLLLISAGVTALITWRQQQKTKALIHKEQP